MQATYVMLNFLVGTLKKLETDEINFNAINYHNILKILFQQVISTIIEKFFIFFAKSLKIFCCVYFIFRA